jgi:hypothetical protein
LNRLTQDKGGFVRGRRSSSPQANIAPGRKRYFPTGIRILRGQMNVLIEYGEGKAN